MIKTSYRAYDEALQYIRTFENDNGVKFNVMAVARGFTDKLSSLYHRKVLFGREDLPYLHVSNGRMTMQCALGGRKYQLPDRSKQKTTDSGDGRRKRIHKRRIPVDAKPCSAEIKILSLIYFPDYKITEDMDKQQVTRMADQLRKHFTAEMGVSHYIVEMDEAHSNHNQPLDIIDYNTVQIMQDLVEKGYYTPASILEQLTKYYETLSVKPDKTDPKYYPSIERIRRQTYPLVIKQRNMEREKGFTGDCADALQRLKDFEKDTYTSYQCSELDGTFGQHDVFESAKTITIQTSAHTERRCRIDTGGVPYMVLGTQHYECSHGIEYRHKYVDPYTSSQRKHLNREGNVMCNARCTFKEVVLFPSYRIDESITQKQLRDAIMEKLQGDIKNRTVTYERIVAYAFPCIDEHCGHAVREAHGHLFLDDKIKSQIAELVSEGVRSVGEMRRHLKMFLKHRFNELEMPGPFNKKYRPSTQTIVNLMCEGGVPPEDIIQDVKDPVYYISKPSDYSKNTKERAKEETPEAVVNISKGNNAQNPYDELVQSLEILQSEQDKARDTDSTAPATNTEPHQKSNGTFLENVFQKQSECQTIMEEILQSLYQLSDMFRLRDLRELLRRVQSCLKEGRLLCDGIAMNGDRRGQEGTQGKAETVTSGITNGVSGKSEEPPTELVTMDITDQTTEVDSQKKSSDIVIYHRQDDFGEQIIVVNENSEMNEVHKQSDVTESNSTDNKGNLMDEKRKDFIQVRCKEFLTKEHILTRLNLTEHKNAKSENSDGSSIKEGRTKSKVNDLDTEIKNQEKEIFQLEKDKMSLSIMETKMNKMDQTTRLCITREERGPRKKKKRKRKHPTYSDEDLEVQHVKRAYATKSESDLMMDTHETDIQDEDFDYEKSLSDKSTTTDTCFEGSNMKDSPTKITLKQKPADPISSQTSTGPVVSKSVTTNQTQRTGLVAINNIVYSNTPLGLIPVLNSNGMPLVIPNLIKGTQSGTNLKLTNTTNCQGQVQTPLENTSATIPGLSNALSISAESQTQLTPNVKETLGSEGRPSLSKTKEEQSTPNTKNVTSTPKVKRIQLTPKVKRIPSTCITKQKESTTLSKGIQGIKGVQDEVKPASDDKLTANMITEVSDLTEDICIKPLEVKLPHVQGADVGKAKESTSTNIRPKTSASIRVIKVNKNDITDASKQYTVADVKVGSGALSNYLSRATVTPKLITNKAQTPTQIMCTDNIDTAVINESREVCKNDNVTSMNSEAKLTTPAEDANDVVIIGKVKKAIEEDVVISPGLTMKTRGRGVRFSRTGAKLS